MSQIQLSVMAKVIAETVCKEFKDINQNLIDTSSVMRILQRPKEIPFNEAAESAKGQPNDESPSSKCSLLINKDEEIAKNDELLSLVTSTSECCKEEMEERFEQNCQLFDVSSEDFD